MDEFAISIGRMMSNELEIVDAVEKSLFSVTLRGSKSTNYIQILHGWNDLRLPRAQKPITVVNRQFK